jgi:hypothetical protein
VARSPARVVVPIHLPSPSPPLIFNRCMFFFSERGMAKRGNSERLTACQSRWAGDAQLITACIVCMWFYLLGDRLLAYKLVDLGRWIWDIRLAKLKWPSRAPNQRQPKSSVFTPSPHLDLPANIVEKVELRPPLTHTTMTRPSMLAPLRPCARCTRPPPARAPAPPTFSRA